VWKDEIVHIVSNELDDIESLGEIDESYFLMRLKVFHFPLTNQNRFSLRKRSSA
jgi:hypothetical protein